MPAFHAAGGTTSASSASIPLEGHCLDARIFRRGRDDLRVVRLRASTRQQLSGLLSPPSGFSPVRVNASTRSNFQVCFLLPQVFAPSASMPAHAATVPVFKRIPSALLYFPLP